MKSWLWLFLLFPGLVHADGTRLASETFDQPNASGNKVTWSSGGNGSLQVVNDSGLGDGKAFEGNKIVGKLPFSTLSGPGDSITVHFTFRLAGPITATLRGFKVGLFEGGDPNDPWFFAAGTGYRWNISTGPLATTITMAKEAGGPNQKVLGSQNVTVLGESTPLFSLKDESKHTATIVIQNNDGTLNLSLAIDGQPAFQSSDPLAPSTLALTRFAIRSDANTFFFDDFTVDTQTKSSQ